MADTTFAGLEGHAGNGPGRCNPGRIAQGRDGHPAESGMVTSAEISDTESNGRGPGRPWGSSGSGTGEAEQAFQNVADTESGRGRSGLCEAGAREADGTECEPEPCNFSSLGRWFRPWPAEPDLPRMAYGVADRLDREKATGNGQVPRVVQAAWEILIQYGTIL